MFLSMFTVLILGKACIRAVRAGAADTFFGTSEAPDHQPTRAHEPRWPDPDRLIDGVESLAAHDVAGRLNRIMATRQRHSPEQIVGKLMAADRPLAEGKNHRGGAPRAARKAI